MINAIIMASGLGTRMLPLTKNTPKPLIKVKNIPMIESIIKGLLSIKKIDTIYIVTGYLKEQFDYLKDKFPNIEIINNPDYKSANNISSIYYANDVLKKGDCFIVEADLYVCDLSVFNFELEHSLYFGKYIKGYSSDWVFEQDKNGFISRIGKIGTDCFNMTGIAFLKKKDALILSKEIEKLYPKESSKTLFWDEVVNNNLDKLKLKIHPIEVDKIYEIDTIEELKAVNEL